MGIIFWVVAKCDICLIWPLIIAPEAALTSELNGLFIFIFRDLYYYYGDDDSSRGTYNLEYIAPVSGLDRTARTPCLMRLSVDLLAREVWEVNKVSLVACCLKLFILYVFIKVPWIPSWACYYFKQMLLSYSLASIDVNNFRISPLLVLGLTYLKAVSLTMSIDFLISPKCSLLREFLIIPIYYSILVVFKS